MIKISNPFFLNSSSGCTDKSIRIWNPLEKDETKMHRVLCGHSGPISCLSFSPDGRYLASASRNDKVIIWSTEVRRATFIFIYSLN